MSTYREAIHYARAGGTARLGDKTVRFLTREEAEPILLATRPDRNVVFVTEKEHNPKKGLIAGQPKIDKNNNIVVETVAPANFQLQRLGLYDVSVSPPVEFRPTDEDTAADWIREGVDDMPEAIAPEAVDAVLAPTDEPHAHESAPLDGAACKA